MKPMRVEPEQLASAAQEIGGCGDDLGRSLDGLQSTVTSGNPWGGDEPGTLFGMAYVEILSYAMEVYGSHVDQLAEAAQGLDEWARTTTQTDQGNADQFTAIHSQMGG